MAQVAAKTQTPNTLVAGIANTTYWSDGELVCAYASTTDDLTFVQTNWNSYSSINGTYAPAKLALLLNTDILYAFDAIESIANVDFRFGRTFSQVDIKIAAFDNLTHVTGGGINGISTFPGTDVFAAAGTGYESFIAYNTTSLGLTVDPLLGASSNRLKTVIHEILHGLGLSHPHDNGDGSSGAWASPSTGSGDNVLDNDRYTIMSYERAGLDQSDDTLGFGYSVTPMALDIAALHHLYGSVDNYAGDTVYTLTDRRTVARDLNGDDGSISIGEAFYSIWDTGGTDTINYAGNNHVLINLNAATLNQSSDSAAIQSMINTLTGSDLYDVLLPAATAIELRNDLTSAQWHAGGFFSRIFSNSGTPDLGGYSIASSQFASSPHQAGAVIENATGSDKGDILIGNESGNTITGNGGPDLMLGQGGTDILLGGAGDDEIYGGTENDLLTGGDGVDRLFGDAGRDTLFPGAEISPNERYDGGSGFDTLQWTLATSYLVDLSTGVFDIKAGGSASTVSSIENVRAAGGDDTLIGSSNHNQLRGGGGNDDITGNRGIDGLFGEAGNDILRPGVEAGVADDGERYDGGADIDTFDFSTLSNSYVVDLPGGTWEGETPGGEVLLSIVENIENVTAGGGDDTLIGNSSNNVLHGGDGNDDITGNGGIDSLFGEAGNDVLKPGSFGAGETYDGGADIDTLDFSALSGSYNVNLTASVFAIGGAVSTVSGIEYVTAGGGDNILVGSASANRLDGGGGNDRAFGRSGNDKLNGGADMDILNGGRGRDLLIGGTERDLFDFNSIKESVRGSQRDKILDFKHGTNITGDDIDLRGIDAKTGVSGNQAFKWIGKQDFHDRKGELRYEDKGSKVIVQGDVNGDGKADFEIFVKVGSLHKGDFFL